MQAHNHSATNRIPYTAPFNHSTHIKKHLASSTLQAHT